MKVWQIVTGEPGRDYRRLFFEHDLMVLGSGEDGDASDGSYEHGSSNTSRRQVHRFFSGP